MSCKTYHIKLNGKVYEVEIEEVKAGESIAPTAETIEKPKAEVKKSTTPSNSETITAPMPGTITNILVKENESVKKGQVLAILEAMKMENEIFAPNDGTVKSVNISKGASVNVGDVLVTLG